MQVRLHAARPALSQRARSASVRVNGGHDAKPSALPELYLLVSCMATCLPRLEELSLDLGEIWYHIESGAYSSILAPLAGLPHLARLSVKYPGRGCADIAHYQASPGHCPGACRRTSTTHLVRVSAGNGRGRGIARACLLPMLPVWRHANTPLTTRTTTSFREAAGMCLYQPFGSSTLAPRLHWASREGEAATERPVPNAMHTALARPRQREQHLSAHHLRGKRRWRGAVLHALHAFVPPCLLLKLCLMYMTCPTATAAG